MTGSASPLEAAAHAGGPLLLVVDGLRQRIRAGDGEVCMAGRRLPLRILEVLARENGQVSHRALFREVWERPLIPAYDLRTLYSQISRLRALLARLTQRRDLIRAAPGGYALHPDVTATVIVEPVRTGATLPHLLAIIPVLRMRGTIDNRGYCALRGISRSTAFRELAVLTRMGILFPVGSGRGAYYRLSESIGGQTMSERACPQEIPELAVLRERTMHPEAEVRFLARRAYHERRARGDCTTAVAVSAAELESVLACGSVEQRSLAVRGCLGAGDAAHARVAIDRVWCEPDAWVRAELVRVIGLKGAGAGPIVAGLLGDPDERVRSNALEVLVAIGHRPHLEEIESIAVGPHHRARAAALVALARLAGTDVRASVWDLMISDRPWLRSSGQYAARVLRPVWENPRLYAAT